MDIYIKYNSLKSYFRPYVSDGICIAYSGGVDSTLLLKTAVDAVQEAAAQSESVTAESDTESTAQPAFLPVLAVILETQLHPHSDTEQAYQMAQNLGAYPIVIEIDEFQNKELLHNPTNRCYLCKHMLFSQLKAQASELGYRTICDGTNKDDEKEYRPGMRVLKELQIKSPLLELGISKAEVRSISAMLGLSTASVPSTPCLATRLPYGAFLDQEVLKKIHLGEQLLRQMGFYNVRLRYHEPILRLEIDCTDFEKLLKHRTEIVQNIKELGFSYITLDLEGFRSGSMDLAVTPHLS